MDDVAIQTHLAHAGTLFDGDWANGDVTAPIHLSTTYRRGDKGNWPFGYAYSRVGNPTRDMFERTMSLGEGGACGVAFSSGMAAAHALLFGLLENGDEVLVSDNVYKTIFSLLKILQRKMNVSHRTIDLSNLDGLSEHVTPATKIVWTEVISNPLCKVVDIPALARSLRDAKSSAVLVVDSTWTTPALCRPIHMGADAVVHSCTKYIGGHSDVMGGIVVLKDHTHAATLRSMQSTIGSVMSPFDCYLATRGLRTLSVRMRCHSQNASKVAEFLQSHPSVTQVHYPGLRNDPGHEAAKRMFSSFTPRDESVMYGGMVSFTIAGGLSDAVAFIEKTRVFMRCTSLGATESLIEPSAGLSGNENLPPSLIRLSVGIEDVSDLIRGLQEGFSPLHDSH